MTMEALTRRELRTILGSFVTGVTVVTTVDSEGRLYGVTANSFSSVSLEPPLVSWSQAHSAVSYPVFRQARHFAINILSEDQISISQQFASAGVDKFLGVEVHLGYADVPLIAGCVAHFECATETVVRAGDHDIFIGRVRGVRHRSGTAPLAFGSGRYLGVHPCREGV